MFHYVSFNIHLKKNIEFLSNSFPRKDLPAASRAGCTDAFILLSLRLRKSNTKATTWKDFFSEFRTGLRSFAQLKELLSLLKELRRMFSRRRSAQSEERWQLDEGSQLVSC